MSEPHLSIIIPTQGRSTLPRALASIRSQTPARGEVEVLVVADTHDPLISDVAAIASAHDARYFEHDAGYHGFGHPQIAHGYAVARGRWLLALGDDDEYAPGALDVITALTLAHAGRVLVFRIEMHPSASRRVAAPFTIWQAPAIAVGNVSGQSVCLPNEPSLFAAYPPHSTGDHEFIRDTVANFGGDDVVTWRPEVIAICR